MHQFPPANSSKPQLPVIDLNNFATAWKYYSQKADEGDINAQLKIVSLALSSAYHKHFGMDFTFCDKEKVSKWLSRAINSDKFDIHKHAVDVTPEDLNRIGFIKIKTKAAQLAVLKILNSKTINNRESLYFNSIRSKIFDYILEFASAPNFDAEVAMAILEVVTKIDNYREIIYDEFITSNPEYVSSLKIVVFTAASCLDRELQELLLQLDQNEHKQIAEHLDLSDALPEKLKIIRNRIICLSPFHDKFAEIYLSWFIQSNQNSAEIIADLIKCTNQFPQLLIKINALSSMHDKFKCLLTSEDFQLATFDLACLQGNNSFDVVVQKYYRWALSSVVFSHAFIAMNILHNKNGLKFLQQLGLNFINLARQHAEVCLLVINEPHFRTNIPIDKIISVFTPHIRHFKYEDMEKLIDELNEKMEVFPRHFHEFLVKAINYFPVIKKVVLNKFLHTFIHDDWENVQTTISAANNILTEQDIAYIISHSVKPFESYMKSEERDNDFFARQFISYMLKKISSFELIVQIMKAFPQFIVYLIQYAHGEFDLNTEGKTKRFREITFEEQLVLAKLTAEAAICFINVLADERLKNKSLTDAMVVKIIKELAAAQPSTAYICGKICLDLLQIDAAYEMFGVVGVNDPDFAAAKYERANIQFCIYKSKANAFENLSAINNTSIFYHPVLNTICQRELNYETSLTQVYSVISVQDEPSQAVNIADTKIPMSHAHQLFGCKEDKSISYSEMKDVWEEYLAVRAKQWFKSDSEELEKLYIRATEPVVNSVGRYRILREYICNEKNRDNDFAKILLKKFGAGFFGMIDAKFVNTSNVQSSLLNIRKGR